MTRRPRRAHAASLGIAALFAATLGGPAFAQETPPEPGAVTEYPNYGGEVTCATADGPGSFNGVPYSGQVKRISAPDDKTVVFELCNPDPAFLAKISFISFAINDTDYLLAHADDPTFIETMNGTGPYKLDEWRRGQEVVLSANDAYWGEKAKTPQAVIRWSSTPGQKFIELQSGAVDGIDNVQPDDLEAISSDTNLQLVGREGFNTLYVGMNHSVDPGIAPWSSQKVRQAIAMGIDRQALIDQFFPAGSEGASHFVPCSMEFACGGDPWYEFDLEGAKALLAEGLTELGYTQDATGAWLLADGSPWQPTVQYRFVDRTYLPLPDQVAIALVDQLANNLGITARIDEVEATTYLDIGDAGLLHGLFLLGWNGDYPDVTNFLDYHFGGGSAARFGEHYEDIVAALNAGNSTADPAAREAAYAEANELIKANVPMALVSHAGSATAWLASAEGAHSSPLSMERLAAVGGGDDGILAFMQSGEPGGLYCADESDGESLRVCFQVMESLYTFETGGFASVPALADSCTSDDLTTWTCTLRDGVTFHDGSTLDAGDVVLSYAIMWDRLNPLHESLGRQATYTYWGGTWGGVLNPAQ